MTCSEFLAGYSDFQDGEAQPDLSRAFESHLSTCEKCRRYHDVVVRGVEYLRAAPLPPLCDDFEDRLRHSIYTVEEERRRARISLRPVSTSAMGVVALTAIMVAALLTPFLFQPTPSVELPPIMARTPVPPLADWVGFRSLQASPFARPATDRGLWGESPTLLYPHSPLGKRSREASVVRTGIQ